MFLMWRILLCVVFAFAIIMYGIKTNKKRIFYVCFFVITLLIYVLLYYCPIENIFVSFKTPEEAFSYINNSEIITIIDGNKSDLILYKSKDNTSGTIPIKKRSNTYKICTIVSKRTITKNIFDVYDISIINVKGTDDYYIEIYGIVDVSKNIEISDNISTEFNPIYENYNDDQTRQLVQCIEHIEYDENYQLFIDGVFIELSSVKDFYFS